MRNTIRNVVLNRTQRQLEIGWSDGSTIALPYTELRRQCPCANCAKDRQAAQDNRLLRVIASNNPTPSVNQCEPVGRYALRLVWDDGHRQGIYSYEQLAALAAGSTSPNPAPSN